jgi:hypothetical protein
MLAHAGAPQCSQRASVTTSVTVATSAALLAMIQPMNRFVGAS